MKEIKLWEISGAALLVPEKTEIVFTNQVNGTACEITGQVALLIICH